MLYIDAVSPSILKLNSTMSESQQPQYLQICYPWSHVSAQVKHLCQSYPKVKPANYITDNIMRTFVDEEQNAKTRTNILMLTGANPSQLIKSLSAKRQAKNIIGCRKIFVNIKQVQNAKGEMSVDCCDEASFKGVQWIVLDQFSSWSTQVQMQIACMYMQTGMQAELLLYDEGSQLTNQVFMEVIGKVREQITGKKMTEDEKANSRFVAKVDPKTKTVVMTAQPEAKFDMEEVKRVAVVAEEEPKK